MKRKSLILPLCILGCGAALAPVGFLAGRYLAPAREIRTWIPERNSANLESSEAIASLDGFKVEGVMVDRIGPRECVHLHLKSVTPVTPVGGGSGLCNGKTMSLRAQPF